MRALVLAAVVATACSSYARGPRASDPPRSVLSGRRENSLRAAVAVRTRKAPLSWQNISVAARRLAAAAAPPQVATAITSAVADDAKLVVEVWIEMEAADVARTAADVAARVVADGGRVVSSNAIGIGSAASSAALELRLPPGKAVDFSDWLAGRGTIRARRTLASDVGKVLVDRALAIANLELEMKRLQELAGKDVEMKQLLDIEKEMTRVRGELERERGEQQWLLDRVDQATLTLTIVHAGSLRELAPHARLYPGAHAAMLAVEGAPARFGGGVTVHVHRYLTFDLDVFPSANGDGRAVVATIGTAIYSGYLGYGHRRFGNPYLGARVGYGYLSGRSATVVAGELGVELYKQPHLLVDAALRALAFVHDGSSDAALCAQLGVSVPF